MPPSPPPFALRKIGHVVLNVTDLDAAVHFYTELLGLEVSDRYPDSMVPGGMVTEGLAICRGIVEAHRGTITAENREGGGALFRITLPSLDPPPPVPPETEQPEGGFQP
jgi:catechol 2,3-dioxygenase-like lactoylglutathione lyase family enzyme